MGVKLKIKIKWERILGLIIISAALFYFYEHMVSVTSVDAFVNADVRNVYAPLFGHLKTNDLKPGQSFKRDELLFEVNNQYIGGVWIYSDYYNLQYRIGLLEMEIAEDQISVKKYEDDLERNEKLREVGGVAEETVKEIRYKLNVLNSGIESKKSQLSYLKESFQKLAAQLELYKKAIVHAPVNGVVWSVYRKDGEYVEAGSIVLQIIDKDNIWVDAFFDEKEAKYLSPGYVVTVIDDVHHKEWQGKISFSRPGQFLKDQHAPNDGVARPKRKEEKGLIAVRIEPIWTKVFSSKEFYGYGEKVTVKIQKYPFGRHE
ncbi:MAG: hypothetical protein A3I43_04080 [Omnitrophica WOR_2 bacterium RIFCSPLOWO2_02_FULL_50_19]|nr:MAG: hypothetical protein A3I43_04080 [Omnitrophica WOR_2 bacterium RIFCSPLOWO2_02_FULL_50_19]